LFLNSFYGLGYIGVQSKQIQISNILLLSDSIFQLEFLNIQESYIGRNIQILDNLRNNVLTERRMKIPFRLKSVELSLFFYFFFISNS